MTTPPLPPVAPAPSTFPPVSAVVTEPKPQRAFRHICNRKTCPGCQVCADPGPRGACRLCSAPEAGPCRYCGGALVAVAEQATLTTFLIHRDRACTET